MATKKKKNTNTNLAEDLIVRLCVLVDVPVVAVDELNTLLRPTLEAGEDLGPQFWTKQSQK